jgi:hypothetical protein
MELTRSTVTERAAEYREEEPLYPVEREQVETLPPALAAGEFGRRDAEWVVRWYYRRFLGAYPDADRRAAEARFRENEFEAVRRAVECAAAAEGVAAKLDALTALSGVDVAVGSAFLFFLDPESHLVVGRREWGAMADAGELGGPYPDPPTVADYETYLDACRRVAERTDCDPWTLYRALWRLGTDA